MGGPYYIDRSERISKKCNGCVHIYVLKFGDIGKQICCRYPFPSMQFLFGQCCDYYKKPSDNEN